MQDIVVGWAMCIRYSESQSLATTQNQSEMNSCGQLVDNVFCCFGNHVMSPTISNITFLLVIYTFRGFAFSAPTQFLSPVCFEAQGEAT